MHHFRTVVNLLNRYKIPFKQLSDGQHEFDFDAGNDFFEAFENEEIKGGNIHISVTADKVRGVMALAVKIVGTITVECDRCLEDCELPVNYEGRLTVRESDGEHESDEDILWLEPGRNEAEMASYIYESSVLSLPMQRVHSGSQVCNEEMVSRLSGSTDSADRSFGEPAKTLGDNPEFMKLKDLDIENK